MVGFPLVPEDLDPAVLFHRCQVRTEWVGVSIQYDVIVGRTAQVPRTLIPDNRAFHTDDAASNFDRWQEWTQPFLDALHWASC